MPDGSEITVEDDSDWSEIKIWYEVVFTILPAINQVFHLFILEKTFFPCFFIIIVSFLNEILKIA